MDVYVCDCGNNRVQVFDSQGGYLRKWDTEGDGNGQFNSPISISISFSSEEVYVCDANNNRIQVFDAQGRYLRKWGRKGDGDGQFKSHILCWRSLYL